MSKLASMRDAIARFVPDGASVCLGTGLEAVIPVGPTLEPTAAELDIVRTSDPEGFWTR